MNDTPQDAWFYSHEGERLGPVAFADLAIKAKEGGLNPRLDLVWKHGMDEWTPAGEIEGLFERRSAPEPEESLAPPMDPYTAPGQESVAEQMGKEVEWPGARRRSYLFLIILFPILWNFLLVWSAPLLAAQFGTEIAGWIMMGAAFLPLLVAIVVSVKRLKNLGMSGWWFLGHLVPLLNVWVGYRSFACPAGYAYHRKLDGIGILLAIIYWLLILVIVVALVAVIALMFGAIGDPELQEKIREIIRKSGEMIPQK